jgi:hypothetical protein
MTVVGFYKNEMFGIEELDVVANADTCALEHLLEKCYGGDILKNTEAINQMEAQVVMRGNALYLFGGWTYDDSLFWHTSRIWSWRLTSDCFPLDLDDSICKEGFYE